MSTELPWQSRLFVSLTEARQILGGVSRNTLYRRINDGHIRMVRNGGRAMIPVSSLRAYAAKIDPQSGVAA